jgi:hypothetical protein
MRRENNNYDAAIAEARRSAQYFIDRGTDAQGREIRYPSAYMKAAVSNAISRAQN